MPGPPCHEIFTYPRRRDAAAMRERVPARASVSRGWCAMMSRQDAGPGPWSGRSPVSRRHLRGAWPIPPAGLRGGRSFRPSIALRNRGRTDQLVRHVAGLTPCLRHISAVGIPASCSLIIPIICASVNRLFLMSSAPSGGPDATSERRSFGGRSRRSIRCHRLLRISLPPNGTRSIRPDGSEADDALTPNPDHSMGGHRVPSARGAAPPQTSLAGRKAGQVLHRPRDMPTSVGPAAPG